MKSMDTYELQQASDSFRTIPSLLPASPTQTKIQDSIEKNLYFSVIYNAIFFLSYATELCISFPTTIDFLSLHKSSTIAWLLLIISTLRIVYLFLVAWRLWHIRQVKTFSSNLAKAKEAYIVRNSDIEAAQRKKNLDTLEYIMTAKLYIQHNKIASISRNYTYLIIAFMTILFGCDQLLANPVEYELIYEYTITYLISRWIGGITVSVIYHLVKFFKCGFGKSEYLEIKPYSDQIPGSKECLVCLEEYQQQEPIMILSCNPSHHVHETCGRRWLEAHDTCPLCRSEGQEIEFQEKELDIEDII